MLEEYNGADPVNIGNTQEITISTLAKKVCKSLGYDGIIEWDTSMPAGQHRKPSSNDLLLSIGWNKGSYTDFDEALSYSTSWFVDRYPNVRGVK